MANAGAEYMQGESQRVRIPSHLINLWESLLPILSPFDSWGECRKDYITLAANQRASWSVMTPVVATPCSIVFSILSPLRLYNR